jgi:hypothetical protein
VKPYHPAALHCQSNKRSHNGTRILEHADEYRVSVVNFDFKRLMYLILNLMVGVHDRATLVVILRSCSLLRWLGYTVLDLG